MARIDLTDRRDFSRRTRYPVLFNTPWSYVPELQFIPWHPRIMTTCECCGKKLNEEFPWRHGRGELCYDCDLYLEVTVGHRLDPTDITAPTESTDDYNTVFVAEVIA